MAEPGSTSTSHSARGAAPTATSTRRSPTPAIQRPLRSMRSCARRDLRGDALAAAPFDSVFLGGGTPVASRSRTAPRGSCGACATSLPIAPDAEWTLEANPESAATERSSTPPCEGGANRISLGVQSFDDGELRLARTPPRREGRGAAVGACAPGGLREPQRRSDLRPARSPRDAGAWERILREAIALSPEHISCYLLDPRAARSDGARCALAARCDLPGEGLPGRSTNTAGARTACGGRLRAVRDLELGAGRAAMPAQRECLGGGTLPRPGSGRPRASTTARGRANLPDLRAYIEALERGEDAAARRRSRSTVAPADEEIDLPRPAAAGRGRLGAAGRARRPGAGGGARARAAQWTATGLLVDDGGRLRLGEEGLFVSNALMAELSGR